MTSSDFKAIFPEFTTVDDTLVNAQIGLLTPYFDVGAWGDFLLEGQGLWVAHRLTMSAQRAASAQGGGTPGLANTATYAMVGSMTMMTDAILLRAQAMDEYQLTTYGQRYAQLARMVGMGAMTL